MCDERMRELQSVVHVEDMADGESLLDVDGNLIFLIAFFTF